MHEVPLSDCSLCCKNMVEGTTIADTDDTQPTAVNSARDAVESNAGCDAYVSAATGC